MHKKIWKRIVIISLAVLVISLASAGVVQAAQTVTGGNVQGPIDQDVFVISQNVTVNGDIRGSVVAFGSTITLNGHIEGDVFLAASRITIMYGTEITGNLYIAGGDVRMDGKVDGSVGAAGLSLILNSHTFIDRAVYFAGYSLQTDMGSQIGQNLHAAAYQTLLQGILRGDAKVNASAVEVRGMIAGNADFNVAAPGEPNFYLSVIPGIPLPANSGLRVYDGAVINGKLKYTSTANQDSTIHIQNIPIFSTPVPGEPEKQAAESKPTQTTTSTFVMSWIWSFLSRLIAYLLLGAVVLRVMPVVMELTRKQIRSKFWSTAGNGFVTIITGLILAILLPVVFVLLGLVVRFLTLGGLNFAWFVLLGALLLAVIAVFFFALFNGSILVSCYTLGDLLVKSVSNERPGRRYLAMLAGVGVYVLLRSAPYFGWIMAPLAAILGMGALWLALLRRIRKQKPEEK